MRFPPTYSHSGYAELGLQHGCILTCIWLLSSHLGSRFYVLSFRGAMTEVGPLFANNPLSGRYFRVFTQWETPLTVPKNEKVFKQERAGILRYPNATNIKDLEGKEGSEYCVCAPVKKCVRMIF